ncbi:MAG: DNA polymerase I [Pseudomonadota bacterium]
MQHDLILVDGSSYLFRAYHALPPLTNSRGEATGAIVGVVNMLRKLLTDYPPRYVAVVFDTPGKTFRDELYPAYKANRPPLPDDLRVQITPLLQVVERMGLPLLVIDGVEADDVIGTLAQQASAAGLSTLISTGDKDLAQLVNDQVTLINTMTDVRLDRQGVMDKYAVWPEQVIDYLALMGDSVDNIPGIPKCGPKTAAKWLAEYTSLDNLIAQAAQIKGKVGENLRVNLDQLALSRQLTTIKCDVPLPHQVTELQPQPADTAGLKTLYQRLESRRLLASLEPTEPEISQVPEVTAAVATDYQTILDEATFAVWKTKLQQADLIALDTETTSLDTLQAELVGLSFAVAAGQAAYLPVGHRYPGVPQQLARDWVLAELRPILENARIRKVGQNLKYDLGILANEGIQLQGAIHDTMLASYVVDSLGRHDMDSLAERYLQHKTTTFSDIAGKGVKQLTFDQIPLEQAGPYAAEDADITWQLHQTLWPKLTAEPDLTVLYQQLEIPLIPVLSRMERTGVTIDRELLQAHSAQLARQLHELEQEAYRIAGRPFNLNSPKQIGEIFFTELKLPVVSKTPKGVPSTAESVLQTLAADGHELPELILQHRSLAKLKSTYTDKLPQRINPRTGRVHTSYHQAVTATGRLSSSDPNLQNIPIRTEVGRQIRQAFVPQTGWRMVAADYSQIELRIMAHLSQDAGLCRAFAEGADIHTATAAEVFAADSQQSVTPDQRRAAKAINFGLIYGMSAFGLAKQLGIERKAAQDYVDLYFSRYPGVQQFMQRTREQAQQDGYVETLFGRRLYLPDITSRNANRRAAAERTAINAPMQGTAADIIKRAMLAIHAWQQQTQPELNLLLQVHDELVFEGVPERLDEYCAEIRQRMESAAELRVPLVVEIGVGDNWQEAH